MKSEIVKVNLRKDVLSIGMSTVWLFVPSVKHGNSFLNVSKFCHKIKKKPPIFSFRGDPAVEVPLFIYANEITNAI